jgi:phosphate starvation-inducible PhoH-like protein
VNEMNSNPDPACEIAFAGDNLFREIFGERDENLRFLEASFQVRIGFRGEEIRVVGESEKVRRVEKLFQDFQTLRRQGVSLAAVDFQYAVRTLQENPEADLVGIFSDNIFISVKGRRITPKSLNQKRYVEAIRNCDMVIGIGPAGTGKTYLAMAMALSALLRKDVLRIVLARPAVEAGEKLGFLPGDIAEKVNPYLRPLYDALHDMMDFERASRLLERGVIEIAPLAFMRGRTLNESFVILDEAQNTTSEQMKMFLTRLGFGSKAVITGDITQVDLPGEKMSGLVEVQGVLKEIEKIRFVYFSERDVVRHPLVQEVIKAYEVFETNSRESSGRGKGANREPKRG